MGKKVPNWECLFVHRKQRWFLSVYVDDIKKWLERQQNMAPIWNKLMNNLDLDEPTSFLDHVNLGCTQRECKPNEIIIEQYTKMFESRVSAGTNDNYLGGAWSYDIEGHAPKCVERWLANKKVKQLCKVSSPCLDDHQFKQKELESVRELSQVCSQIVFKMLVLGTSWETRHSTVCPQTCKRSYNMDSGFRQTMGTIGFMHSSHK